MEETGLGVFMGKKIAQSWSQDPGSMSDQV